MKTKYKIGFIIGRFQPFHFGHKYLIERALEHAEKIYIGIGSINITNSSNPYSLEVRLKFLVKFIQEEKLEKKILGIIPLEDIPDDNKWLNLLLKKTGPVDVEIGDNEWVNGIFENAGIPVIRIGHYMRETLEGTKIRKNIDENLPWEDRVPPYIVDQVKKR